MTNYTSIKLAIDAGVAVLTLDRPEALNCFTTRMHEEMQHAFGQIQQDGSVRCLVLTGNGRGFCAGQDLNDRKFDPGNPPDLGTSLTDNYNPLIRTITSLPLPVVCAVNGVAAGAGLGIALACDIVLAAKSASFIASFCKVGLGMDCGSSWSLPALAGLARARGIAMLGEKISATQAEEWGVIWKCVADDDLMNITMDLASRLAIQPTKGLGIIKQELLAASGNSLDEQLDMEARLQRIAGQSEDYREGVIAFLEKRVPEFKGK